MRGKKKVPFSMDGGGEGQKKIGCPVYMNYTTF